MPTNHNGTINEKNKFLFAAKTSQSTRNAT